MQEIEFRRLQSSEYKNLIELWQKAGLSHKPLGRDTEDNIKKQLQCKTNRFIIAVCNEKIIGSVIASHNFRKGWLNRLAIHPAYRKQGLARKLINLAEEFFQTNNIQIYACLIEDDNITSKKLFTQINYEEHRDNIYFTKRLNKKV